MEGRSAEAIEAARGLGEHVAPEMLRAMPMIEYFVPTLLFAYVRFGRWDDVLAAPRPPDEFAYSLAMWHHARGLALAATGKLADAETSLAELRRLAATVPSDRIVADNQPARMHLELAEKVLAGELAARRGRTDEAVRTLTDAVAVEDRLPYTEPPPWYQPVRHRLGALLLQSRRAADAEAVYREDLRRNPDNGWSLFGLHEALERAGKREEAATVAARLHRAWARADVRLTASVL
jgi:tetratricopeptide (TPR) repeat protein